MLLPAGKITRLTDYILGRYLRPSLCPPASSRSVAVDASPFVKHPRAIISAPHVSTLKTPPPPYRRNGNATNRPIPRLCPLPVLRLRRPCERASRGSCMPAHARHATPPRLTPHGRVVRRWVSACVRGSVGREGPPSGDVTRSSPGLARGSRPAACGMSGR